MGVHGVYVASWLGCKHIHSVVAASIEIKYGQRNLKYAKSREKKKLPRRN